MQGNNYITARENPSGINYCHEVAKAMFHDGFMEQIPKMNKHCSLILEDNVGCLNFCCMCDVK